MPSNIQIPSTKAVISAAASVAATAMLIRSFAKDYIPGEFRHYFLIKLHNFFAKFTNEVILVIDEFDGLSKNQLFKATEVYLGSIISPSTKKIRATLPDKEEKISISMEKNQELTDKFSGFQLKWRMVCKQIQPTYFSEPGHFDATRRSELRYYELIFHKKHRDKVVDEYLPYVLERSKAVELEKKTLKLFTLADGRRMRRMSNPWESVNLDHPATFDTLAMDTDTKKMVIDDLERFVGSKELYRKAGKAWKRGYLLFGPPGTGKSSLIAAMANYLNFDIYDLELTGIRSNFYLRRYLISTANRCILVVEDIDCSIELTQKRPNASQAAIYPHQHSQGSRVTLSGLLNFIDGLWSSCGDERIIVFTTNHKDKLDPALLRPGRMDVHIHMSYCTPCGFKLLASNYLGITEHALFLAVEQLMKVTKVTPAVLLALEEKGGSEGTICISLEAIKQLINKNQVPHAEAEGQLTKKDEANIVLRGLVQLLQIKKETEELKGSEKESGSTGKLLPDFKGKDGNNLGTTDHKGSA